MKLRKIPYQLTLLLLTTGASLILGFLSFGGMYAIWPVLPVALAAFGLSVAYEGEIYLQNITGAMNKLFKHHYLQRQLAKAYLLENFPDTEAEDTPEFFKDYQKELRLLHAFGDKNLDKAGRARKKQVQKTLSDMEKWFAEQLFQDDSQPRSAYEEQLHQWLLTHGQADYLARFNQRQSAFKAVKGFSLLAGAFMGLGTTYLLMEAFSTIPMLAAIPLASWPFLIVPMAGIAGAAYGLLTYNAVTDMISNDTLRKWYHKIRHDLSQGVSLRNAFITATAGVLVMLALALTVCTAGTWWTVAKETPPLFNWMRKMPGFIMGVINPIITGLSSVVFNLQNTSESLEIIEQATHTKENLFTRLSRSIKAGWSSLTARENAWQIVNPFRLLLKVTITPLRLLLFLGHLISIGVTADRVPGISQRVSALLGIISEGFEDMHYFMDHDHEHHHDHGDDVHALLHERLGPGHGHSHDADLPTRFLKLLFSPVYLLAAGWDALFSGLNKKEGSESRPVLSFAEALKKQTGEKPEEQMAENTALEQPSSTWKVEQAIYRIERHKEKHLHDALFCPEIAQQQLDELSNLQDTLRSLSSENELQQTLNTAKQNRLYGIHRFFDNGPTATAAFLEELPQRVSPGLSSD